MRVYTDRDGRRILVLNSSDSGKTIDLGKSVYHTIRIASPVRDNPPKDITITGGTVKQLLVDNHYNYRELAELSHKLPQERYLETLDQNAPKRIAIKGTTFVPSRNLNSALYTMPGVNRLQVMKCKFIGECKGSVVYLNSETHHNVIAENDFGTQSSSREYLSIDGSYNNSIEFNTFRPSKYGAIRLYRNCGEGGRVRYAQAHDNYITGNRIGHCSPVHANIWKNARYARRCYCIPEVNNDPPYNNVLRGNEFPNSRGIDVRPAENDHYYDLGWYLLDQFEVAKWKAICLFKKRRSEDE